MSSLLLWLDMEMTGLDPQRDRPIEIATLITSAQLDIIAVGPEVVIHQDDGLFRGGIPRGYGHIGAPVASSEDHGRQLWRNADGK